MSQLIIRLERHGVLVPVGRINGNGPSDAQFSYDEDYLRDPDAVAVSISLPNV